MLAALAVLVWASLCWSLSAHWAANAQYSFGWLVPLLALFLFWSRWPQRPPPGAPSAWARPALLVLALLYAPVWFLLQPNPEWRLLSWALGLMVVLLLTAGLASVGGRSWARYFAFPVCFILTAIPWPGVIEQPIVLGLMHVVAGAGAHLLHLCGIAAVAQGSIIQLVNGAVGVDEACSGVRSLQASLMAALFLGELQWLRPGRRFALLGAGVLVAFLGNVGRATFLAARVSAEGSDAIARYHDPAGFTVLTICFALIWLVSIWLARGQPGPAGNEAHPPAPPLPRALTWTLAAWLVLTLGGAEWWFRGGPAPRPPALTFVFPETSPHFQKIELKPTTAAQLQPDLGRVAAWSSPSGQWLAYSFQWFPGTSRARILARLHKPDACLPSTGWQMTEERAPILLPFGGVTLPFRALTFGRSTDHGDEFAHIYFCIWQEHANGQPEPADDNLRLTSLRLIGQRERGLGQQILEVVLAGADDGPTADAAFRQEIAPLLRYEPK